MKKYITNLYGQSRQSTAMSAQHMIAKIAQNEGYSELSIGAYSVNDDSEEEKRTRIEGILSSVSKDSLVIAQMPSWNGIAFDKVFLKMLRERTTHLVVFVHDFVPLMFANNAYLMQWYLGAYNLADLVILPSEKMEHVLRENGLTSTVHYQSVWDHVTGIELVGDPQFQRKLKFAGNTSRFPFVKDWASDLPLEVFSDGDVSGNGFLKMMGWQSDEQLLRELHKGGFGLVWSEDIENQYEREYSEMNVSFKFSTYLAAGLPLIVNKGLAREPFVKSYGLGLVAESLEEAVEQIKSISEEEYQAIVQRVRGVGNLVREGFFTKQLLLDIEERLILTDVSRRKD